MLPRYVYRVLRDDESKNWQAKGLVAKSPDAKYKVVQHVNGTINSQFISTTADHETAVNFAGLAMEYNQRQNGAQASFPIVRIDLTELRKANTIIINLTDPAVLDKELPKPKQTERGRGFGVARKNATKYKEVLIVGQIPANCIQLEDYDISESDYSPDDYSQDED